MDAKQLADDLRAEQTKLGPCREATGEGGPARWDRLQRVIDYLAALSDAAQAPLADALLVEIAEEIMKGMRAIATWAPRRDFAVRVMRERLAAPVAPQAPEGFALVPLRLTRAMDAVLSDEGWQWEDLLAAAEAITAEQYNEITAAPVPPAAVAPSGLTEDQWIDLATRHANADWHSADSDGYLNAVKALCADYAVSRKEKS